MGKKLLLLLGFMFQMHGLIAVERDNDQFQATDLAKFLEKYRCSEEIENQLSDQSIKQGEFYLKGRNLTRIINAGRLRRFIENQDLKHVKVADKCWSQKYNQIVAMGIHDDKDKKKLSISELQELAKITEETGFTDWKPNNVLRNKETEKLSFIDTEDASFNRLDPENYSPDVALECLKRYYLIPIEDIERFKETWFKRRGFFDRLNYVPSEVKFHRWLKNNGQDKRYLDYETAQWLDDRIALLKKDQVRKKSLKVSTQWDDLGIDMVKVASQAPYLWGL